MNISELNLFTAVADMAESLGSLYRNNSYGKRDLLEYMDVNSWFGINATTKAREPVIMADDFERFRDRLTLWLSAYKKSGSIKIDLMLRHFSNQYPVTCRLYREFLIRTGKNGEPAAWKLLDYILSEIDREIIDYNEVGLNDLLKRADTEISLNCAKLFAEFLRTSVHKGEYLTEWLYHFEPRGKPEVINDAYTLNDFSIMAYCIYNKEMWAKLDLINKAAKSKTYASLWLFAALHFVCALRESDMIRLPAPALPYDRETVMKRILDGGFSIQEACTLVVELCTRLKLKPLKPSKTSARDNVPSLKLFVPESLKAPLGVIIALALAHRPEVKPGDKFILPNDNLSNARSFFGEDFVNALGKRRFSTRRCNKSYLQGIAANNQNDEMGKPKGYMLAALARSHKGGIGNLAKTTDIYLKDARFSGYSPEFIIREMFERGILSFIPAILLETYCGHDYVTLPIQTQTLLIGEIGLDAQQIEWMTAAAARALTKSRIAVNSILRDPSTIREGIGGILQNIAAGCAPSHHEECLCLMTAAGFSCRFPERGGCVGCGYEIYTKSAMHMLMKEYARLTKLKNETAAGNIWRYEKILEQAILPAVSEMIATVKLYCDDNNIAEYLDIVERGIEYAGHSL